MKVNPKILQLGLLVLLVASIVLNFALAKINREVNSRYENASQIMNDKLNLAIIHNKEEVSQNIKEKYRADMVSYEALSKRAQLLRQENIELKEQNEKQSEEIEALKKQLKKKRR
jgi:hypothetical protein